MARKSKVKALLHGRLEEKDGTEEQLLLEATANQMIFSPQTLMCKEKGICGSYSGDEEKFELKLNDQAAIFIPYDS
jgi:hypothetical protein